MNNPARFLGFAFANADFLFEVNEAGTVLFAAGAMIMKMGHSRREDALLTGMVKLCGEMKLDTIAEWIEDEAMAEAARQTGLHHGQGRCLGTPVLDIPHAVQPAGKRKGIKESWG
jgi:EAL domain-containing protein (putative c-di-GMP-specific phosphodiesterase class I)